MGNLVELRRKVSRATKVDEWTYVEREGMFENGMPTTSDWAIGMIEKGKFVFHEMHKEHDYTIFTYIPAW